MSNFGLTRVRERVTKQSPHEGTKVARGLEHMEYDLKMRNCEADNLEGGEIRRFDLLSSTT